MSFTVNQPALSAPPPKILKPRIPKVTVMVDIESCGPVPPRFSMLSLGAVVVDDAVGTPDEKNFYVEFQPILGAEWDSYTTRIHGFTYDASRRNGKSPGLAMVEFEEFLKTLNGKPEFFADTGGFDWGFVNFYFWNYLARNPFGHTARDARAYWIGVAAAAGDKRTFADLRPKGMHNHNALDDARSNAIALKQAWAIAEAHKQAHLTKKT